MRDATGSRAAKCFCGRPLPCAGADHDAMAVYRAERDALIASCPHCEGRGNSNLGADYRCPICGRIDPDQIVRCAPYGGLGDALICQHCHHELSWAPSPAEYVEEDRGYETPCLIWRRALDAYGYGKRGRGRKWTFAHRDAYEAEYGEIPEGYVVHHKCDQKDCLRPDHLEAISRADHVRLHRAGKPFIGGRRRD